ncbi:SH2 domain-containing protein 3C-like isoform X2 [Acanthaster planci]|nr:SH2 domain-containing protein 3C-like isoform X2 [Acanthaster planci]XP_022100996.1 SH2 domain-containing protein 3C-like isoform X2 [Acanthaster planci]XP_022100997.1 SH2 domain-containing protein 3C-like isoform X2 [Acanthaster planci]XP_022100998.1 SH2 domain-containing protein 3C-like isoform X2 [Acanthaster planci]XP_022100999.1 SH2 domain-containing protein 3C-like isoform X2 [Acanthaster planci]XP_022101000.1 SH2 domain-containing protein 3C-like isoform X2 [Acanthaster planci]XP_02
MAFHLTVEHWLKALELEEYFPLFQHYQAVENLLHLSERHISELGVTNSAHRARLASNLVYIREKLKRTSITGGPLTTLTQPRQRSSIAGSPYGSPAPSPSIKASFRYSTIPEGVTPELPTSPKTFKMDYHDTSPEDLRKELESELKLPNDDIRSHAWFHGGISRDKVEKLLISNGDFLVRDSISQPGNYVLSVRWRNAPMHFVINKVILQADTPYASIQYQFEQECFDSIPSLIRFYIGNAQPVSQTSGAVIQRPVNRSVPLSFIDSKYAAINRSQASAYTYGVLPRRVVTPRQALAWPQDTFRQRSGSQPAIIRSSMVDPTALERSESSPTINRPMNGFALQALSDKSEHRPLGRTGSEPILEKESLDKDYVYPAPDASSVGDLTAPPLPPFKNKKSSSENVTNGNAALLTETVSVMNRSFDPPSMFVMDHVYSEIDEYDQLPIRYSILHDKSDPIPPPQEEENGNELESELKEKKRHSDTRNSVLDTDYSKVAEIDKNMDKKPGKLVTPLPQLNEPSCIHLADFSTPLMGSENKPLEGAILADVKQRLLDTDAVNLAKHITKIDFEMCRITETSSRQPGLEVITLPQGVQIRQDLLERYHCLKTWCAVCVLTCTEPEQRIRMLHQWIQIAEALRGSLGNLFSFTAVMDGLSCKQLTQLKKSWELLRSLHTSSAVNYDTKLRSVLKSLNSGENAIPLTKTSIPHIIPVMQLLERDWTTLTATDWSVPASAETLEGLPRGESWEESATGFGLDSLLNHLQNAHAFCQQANLYRINANSKLTKFLPDEALLDTFRPEFHMRLLWGSKGATAGTAERYQKFAKILSVMAEKIEPIGPGV